MLQPMLGMAAAAVSIQALKSAFTNIVNETMLLEKNLLRTDQMLIATGRSAEITTKQMHEMARELALQTLGSTEGIMQAQQVMLSFKNIATDSFQRVTEMALDLATVNQTDVKSSMVMLGKALEDPIRGLSSMRRVGVSFTASQE